MTVDLQAATDFMATHGRLLDRRRLALLLGSDDVAGVLAALDGHRNPDGGYGWGLEGDLRSTESQPGAAAHAFEVFEQLAPATVPQAVALCDWLDAITLPGGGMPMALPLGTTAGSGPWWAAADPAEPSLQITAFNAAAAARVAAHDPAVAEHPWLAKATHFCLDAIAALDQPPPAYVLLFCVNLLDAVHDHEPEAPDLLGKLGSYLPADGRLSVHGGTGDEALRPLDLAPHPDRPARGLLAPEVFEADLDRLERGQQDDGGWTVDFESRSPAGRLDWRGYATVAALDLLSRNRRLTLERAHSRRPRPPSSSRST